MNRRQFNQYALSIPLVTTLPICKAFAGTSKCEQIAAKFSQFIRDQLPLPAQGLSIFNCPDVDETMICGSFIQRYMAWIRCATSPLATSYSEQREIAQILKQEFPHTKFYVRNKNGERQREVF